MDFISCASKLGFLTSYHIQYYLFITGVPAMVPDITVNENIAINRSNVTLTLNWGEPSNNLDRIANYTVSCSGDVTCPPNFTTTDNTTRSYTITNLTTMTNYTFSVVATNCIGSGEAGVVMITTPPGVIISTTMSSMVVTTTVFSNIPTSTPPGKVTYFMLHEHSYSSYYT